MNFEKVNFPATSVVLAAGLGTRFLPTTKSVPKELFPVVDTPAIELVAEEAALAGSARLLIVTSPEKEAIVRYFDHDARLEGILTVKGKTNLLEKINRAPNLLAVTMVNQGEPLGIAHAVSCVEPFLAPEEDAIAVLLPDDLLDPPGVLTAMARVRQKFGGSVLCAFVADEAELSSYGVFDIDYVDGPDNTHIVGKVKSMVEKPRPGQAPSRFAAAGRYLLDREIFTAIKHIEPGVGGEFQLTDAVAYLINNGHPVHVIVHQGTRHDTGNPSGYIKAVVDFALERNDIGPQLRTWLEERLAIK